MADFKRVPSSVFRLTYVREDVPVAVTVLGRAIGYYIPVGAPEAELLRATSRPGQELDGSGPADPGRTEASQDVSSSPSGAVDAPQAGNTAKAAAGTSTAGMTQAERDRVLRRVRKA